MADDVASLKVSLDPKAGPLRSLRLLPPPVAEQTGPTHPRRPSPSLCPRANRGSWPTSRAKETICAW